MADVGNLVANLELRSAQFIREMGKVRKSVQNSEKRMESFGKVAKRTFAGVVGIATIRRLNSSFRSLAQEMDDLAKRADRVGVSVETFQAWRINAELAGVATTEFDAAMERAARRLGLAAREGGPAAKALENYKVAVVDASGAMRDTEDIIRDFAQRMSEVESPALASAAATAIFGDDAKRMTPFVQQGADALAEFEQKARDMGLVMSRDVLKSAERFNDEMTILSAVFKAGIAEQLEGLIPIFTGIASATISAVQHLRDFTDLLGGTPRGELVSEIYGIRLELMRLERVRDSLTGESGFWSDLLGFTGIDQLMERFGIETLDDVEESIRNLNTQLRAYQQTLASLDRIGKPNEIRINRGGDTEDFALNRLDDSLARSFQEADLEMLRLGDRTRQTVSGALSRALEEGATNGAKSAARIILQTFQRALFDRIADRLALALIPRGANVAGGGAGGFLSKLFGFLPGFQHGGSFVVGGAGGPDSQLVGFRATPGERVTVDRPGMGGGDVHIHQTNNFEGGANGVTPEFVAAAMEGAVSRAKDDLRRGR